VYSEISTEDERRFCRLLFVSSQRIPSSEQGFSRLDKERGLVCSARVSDVGHIDQQREFGAVCFRLWQAKSEAAPATVGGESFFGVPLGFLDKAREGEEGL
jgi:hypothetical protein